jgi:predicted TIM-barrel fold metal-dependent hydrolase
VHVKVSALFRASAEPPPHKDLQPRVRQLLESYGARRLMWGSDFPFVLLGGQERNGYALNYAQASFVPSEWEVAGLDEQAREQLMGGTAQRLFGF